MYLYDYLFNYVRFFDERGVSYKFDLMYLGVYMVKKVVIVNIFILLFDYDGILINLEVVYYKLWYEILLFYGVLFFEFLYCDMMVGVLVK